MEMLHTEIDNIEFFVGGTSSPQYHFQSIPEAIFGPKARVHEIHEEG